MQLDKPSIVTEVVTASLVCGRNVDDFLDLNVADAATFCRGAVWLHSRVLAGPADRLRHVLFHELVHVAQFSGGATWSDSRAEAEADASAARLSNGSVACVVHRPARCPAFIPALCLNQPPVDFYRTYGTEPGCEDSLQSISVGPTIQTFSPVTLELLLSAIEGLHLRAGTDLLVVMHGTPNGIQHPALQGLRYPLMDSRFLSALNADTSNAAALTQVFVDMRRRHLTTTRQVVRIDPTTHGVERTNEPVLSIEDIARMRAARDRVRRLGIGTVHFRGCSIGATMQPDPGQEEEPNNIATLRDFLGCRAVCAPDISNVFGRIDLHLRARGLGAPRAIRRSFSLPNGRGVEARLVGDHLHVYVDRESDFDAWRVERFGATTGAGNRLLFHIMSGPTLGHQLIFPTDPAYSSHLVDH